MRLLRMFFVLIVALIGFAMPISEATAQADSLQTVTVPAGATLAKYAKAATGDWRTWEKIFDLNVEKGYLTKDDLTYDAASGRPMVHLDIGQKLVIPVTPSNTVTKAVPTGIRETVAQSVDRNVDAKIEKLRAQAIEEFDLAPVAVSNDKAKPLVSNKTQTALPKLPTSVVIDAPIGSSVKATSASLEKVRRSIKKIEWNLPSLPSMKKGSVVSGMILFVFLSLLAWFKLRIPARSGLPLFDEDASFAGIETHVKTRAMENRYKRELLYVDPSKLNVVSIERGEGHGPVRLHVDGEDRLKILTGQQIYLTVVEFPDGEEECVYLLSSAGYQIYPEFFGYSWLRFSDVEEVTGQRSPATIFNPPAAIKRPVNRVEIRDGILYITERGFHHRIESGWGIQSVPEGYLVSQKSEPDVLIRTREVAVVAQEPQQRFA